MNYANAKAVFFQELQLPEDLVSSLVTALSDAISDQIFEAYLTKEYDTLVYDALRSLNQTLRRVQDAAQAANKPSLQGKYRNWQDRNHALMADVANSLSHADIDAEQLGGGKRRQQNLFDVKLPRDAAVLAIESLVDYIYSHHTVSRKRRVYHAAGLLYYLGYEQFVLRQNEAFPSKLTEADTIHRRYRAFRTEAKKYLSPEAKQEAEDRIIELKRGKLAKQFMLAKLLAEENRV